MNEVAPAAAGVSNDPSECHSHSESSEAYVHQAGATQGCTGQLHGGAGAAVQLGVQVSHRPQQHGAGQC